MSSPALTLSLIRSYRFAFPTWYLSDRTCFPSSSRISSSLGFLSAHPVLHDAGSLLEHVPPLTVRIVQDVFDHLLFDHGVGMAARSRVGEELLDILQAAGGLVDEILAYTRAVHLPRDHDLGIIDGKDTAGVVDRHVDDGASQGLLSLRAVEYDVLHLRPAQLAGALLSQNPADRIDDVRLAAAVRAEDGGYTLPELKGDGEHERLKPNQFQFRQAHWVLPSSL
jgi:hypothetical protein